MKNLIKGLVALISPLILTSCISSEGVGRGAIKEILGIKPGTAQQKQRLEEKSLRYLAENPELALAKADNYFRQGDYGMAAPYYALGGRRDKCCAMIPILLDQERTKVAMAAYTYLRTRKYEFPPWCDVVDDAEEMGYKFKDPKLAKDLSRIIFK